MTNEKVYIFTCSHQESDLIEAVSKHLDGGINSLFRKGIILMSVVLRAMKNNQRLAIIDENNKILDIVNV
jgi:hypothetical protein